ncbi:protein COFACTOR ASSEMBLY OF COMPLEX C SUBUNIT B CCB2, chloroplastic-like [Zingiber officinale]|uniref:protein COFACTOR ASSEMBLY OF COMPLEX C SUBUNIT B CCB2, chloroplastic-like n=1 Tax=Zingiber officinale TaxID=94328 RepID=UPI001C4B7798|nr:protein COFACTOR ASSEMBLY OF COMPLEX C SUBUNIT B CCB2, chloroplastic-like [Zingiber officinale]
MAVSGCRSSAVAGVKWSFIRTLPTLPTRGPPPFLLLPGSTRALVRRRFLFTLAARDSNPQQQKQQQQEINVSILRFTFGIPGLDESYLPRYLGIALGTLIVINHVFSAASATPAQLRTEALGIFLATFSIILPYLGRFLEGAIVDRTSLPEGNRQIFLMPNNISDDLKEDMAWASYALLRTTNSISVIIAVNDGLCIRGYWNMPEDEDDSRDHLLQWFGNGIQQSGFFDLKETVYFPESLGSELRIPLPKGTLSMLVQPVIRVSDAFTNSIPPLENEGFLLLASNVRYAYSKKDRAWIKAVANKFLHTSEVKNTQGFVTSL